MMACPDKKESASYSEAERGLRLAININEVAYNSWNTVYESMGRLHRTGRISEARWAAINAIDGVIVLSEADLIEGIERSKRLLATWRQASARVLSAESSGEVNALRERETEAHRNFDSSIEFLNVRSLKLRDSYQEALNISVAVAREGHALPIEQMNAIRSVIKMVDDEMNRVRKGNQTAHRVQELSPATSQPPQKSVQKPSQKPALNTRARSVKDLAKK
ncbi:MAG TPA: hypothetical protein VFD58_33595 [Blastocatellia bacterium]|nr:hypothetical protein [Blastocatellia bacterium]